MNENGWDEYQRLVLEKLKQNDASHNEIAKTLTDIKVDIGQLKVKSGVWGGIAGFITAAIALIIALVKSLID